MPRVVSGMRTAISFVTPSGAAEVAREIDFQLGAQDGIQIYGVQGYGNLHDDTPATSATVPSVASAVQTLHLETGETEDLPDQAGEDLDDIDTEIFYVQQFIQSTFFHTTTGAGISLSITPPGIWVPPEPILSPRNIIHKGTTNGADQLLEAGLLIFFKYVTLSNAELGVALARR